MQEYKFRGKRTDNGQWVYGYLCFIYVDCDKASIYDPKSVRSYDVDLKTVGQYIRINDKHKKEIYEGDIVEVTWANKLKSNKYIVKYAEDCAYYLLENITDEYDLNTFSGYSQDQLEVVGNIYSNPELLK
jgi:uncharacterized phage protein (TIGR01671 family)